MLSKRSGERIAGVLCVLLFVAFAVGSITGDEIDFDRDQIRQSMERVIEDQGLIITSNISGLAMSLLLITSAGALYRVFQGHDRFLALFSLIGLLAAGVFLAMSLITELGVFFLARDFVDGFGDADSLASAARAIALMGSMLFLTALTLVGVGMLSVGALIVRTRAAPRWLGWWAVASGVLALAAFIAPNTPDALFIIPGIGGILAVLFFLFIGVWLLRRGTLEAASE